MKTQQLSNNLRNHVANVMQQKRKFQLGILKPLIASSSHQQIREIMLTHVVGPIVNDLNEITGKNITFQIGKTSGFFYLLVDLKKFTVLYIPNPSTGRIFVKFLNHHGAQCSSTKPLNNTCQIVDYLNEFNLSPE